MTDLRKITWIALGALVAGLLVGAALAASQAPGLARAIAILEPVGTLWINAVRMTIVPLVVSMLLVAVASSESLTSMGRIGGAALGFFLITMVIVAVLTAVFAPLLLAGLRIDPQAAEAMRATASGDAERVTATVRGMGGVAQRIMELIPANPIRAAADGAMLPMVVFTMILGAALSQLPAEQRDVVVRFFAAIAEAMLVVVRWVFIAAPIGVFALAVVVGARLGFGAVGAIAYYVGAFVLLMLGVTVLMYVIAVVVGRVPLRLFATALVPAQVIALGSRSSSAALPAMIEGTRDVLRLPASAISFVLPTAVAIYRISTPISFILGALFLSRLYGVHLELQHIVSLAVLSILLSYSVPGVPSGSLFLMAPIFAEYGIPVEGIAILIAVDAIPDLAKTVGNVTSHVASAVVVARVAG